MVVQTSSLRPHRFAEHNGLLFDMEAEDYDGPAYRGITGVLIVDKKLYLIFSLAQSHIVTTSTSMKCWWSSRQHTFEHRGVAARLKTSRCHTALFTADALLVSTRIIYQAYTVSRGSIQHGRLPTPHSMYYRRL